MRLPNFLVVGAAKSGTTSLFRYLEQHPDVFASSVKEPSYFAFPDGRLNLKGPVDEASMHRNIHRKTVKSFDAYRNLFMAARHETAVGEASPRYLYIPAAVDHIERHLGAPKIIAILRNPIERAYSHFLMNWRRGLEPLADFKDALAAEPERIAAGWDWDWHYVGVGRYGTQLQRFVDRFGEANVQVLLYDDLKRDPVDLMRQVFVFLGVDPSFTPDTRTRHMVGHTASNNLLTRLAFGPENTLVGRLAYRIVPPKLGLKAQALLQSAVGRLPGRQIPPITGDVRERLRVELRTEIEQLASLIGRDLSAWLAPRAPPSPPAASALATEGRGGS